MFKDFDMNEFINPEVIKKGRVNNVKQKYIDIINNVIDARRDRELESIIFEESIIFADGEGFNCKVRLLLDTIEEYNKVKKDVKEYFEEHVEIRFKSKEDEE